MALTDAVAGTNADLRGHISPATTFARIERDARNVRPLDLFVALVGERYDGHAFVGDAAANGAAAALVTRAWADASSAVPIPVLAVDDTTLALQQLASWWRSKLATTVIGITGSLGKTSTKEVVAAVLGERFRTYRSPGNLNNEIGLPLSLLDVEPETEVAVLEMGGAYAHGEIALLSTVARQRIAIVTNVHPIHLERMGTIEAIAQTKAELVEAVPPDGFALLNGDDPLVRGMAPRCRGTVIFWGRGEANDVRAADVEPIGVEGSRFTLRIGTEQADARIGVPGDHAVDLALPALAAGHALGMSIAEMLPGLLRPEVRVRLLVVPGMRRSTLIDDTYNASTPSVLSALGLLAAIDGRRKIAVLGDMRELGERSEREHRLVGRRAAAVADLVVTFGEEARVLAAEAGATRGVDGRGPVVTSFGRDERRPLIDFLRREVRAGDVLLLKGSRGLQMEEMVAALRADVGTGAEG